MGLDLTVAFSSILLQLSEFLRMKMGEELTDRITTLACSCFINLSVKLKCTSNPFVLH